MVCTTWLYFVGKFEPFQWPPAVTGVQRAEFEPESHFRKRASGKRHKYSVLACARSVQKAGLARIQSICSAIVPRTGRTPFGCISSEKLEPFQRLQSQIGVQKGRIPVGESGWRRARRGLRKSIQKARNTKIPHAIRA
jgi:hypothetical protein